MTRENKVALVIGFALVLFVGILISDHLSKAQTQRTANLVQAVNTQGAAAAAPARFVDLRTELPPRPSKPVPLVPQPPATERTASLTQAAPIAIPPAETATDRTREVRPGESLSTICQQVYGTATLTSALAAHNDIDDPDNVWAGRQLLLPDIQVLTGRMATPAISGGDVEPAARFATYRIEEGETLSDIARRFMGSAGRWRQLYELNRHAISDPDHVRAGTVLRVPSG